MLRFSIFFVTFLITCCKPETNNTDASIDQSVDSVLEETTIDPSAVVQTDSLQNAEFNQIEFGDYIARIPQIDLPFKFSCDSGLVWPEIDYENNVIKKYKPDGAAILGKLFEKDGSVGFIYTFPADVVFPIIFIYEKDGEERSRIDLFELRDCVSDLGYYGRTRGQITKDLELEATIELIECNDENEQICDTTRTSFQKNIY